MKAVMAAINVKATHARWVRLIAANIAKLHITKRPNASLYARQNLRAPWKASGHKP